MTLYVSLCEGMCAKARFYRAMHIVQGRYCYHKLSDRLSVCLSVCL